MHASLDLSWSRGMPNENDPGPQSLQNNTLTLHTSFSTLRAVPERNHCHLLASGELNLRYGLMLSWHRLEHQSNREKFKTLCPDCTLCQSNHEKFKTLCPDCTLCQWNHEKFKTLCPDCTLCRTLCRPMQAAATSCELALCQHAEEHIVHKPNQIKLV